MPRVYTNRAKPHISQKSFDDWERSWRELYSEDENEQFDPYNISIVPVHGSYGFVDLTDLYDPKEQSFEVQYDPRDKYLDANGKPENYANEEPYESVLKRAFEKKEELNNKLKSVYSDWKRRNG